MNGYLGDACDPVPCPLFTTETELLYQSNNPLYRYQTSQVTAIVHTPVGANSRQGGPEVPVDVERSLYRYCIDDPANQVQCTDARQTNFELAEEVPTRLQESRFNTWHRITIGGNSNGERGTLTYQTGERRQWSWNWLADVKYWRASPLISDTEWIPDPNPVLIANPNVLPLPTWNVTGRLWILGDTGVGISELASTGGRREDWVHPLASGTEFPVTRSRALASHYEVLSPLQVRSSRSRVPAAINAALLHCRYCPESLEVPSEEDCPVCGIPGLSKRDPRILTQVGPEELAWLGPGGSLYPVITEELSNSVALKLQEPGWLSASESSPELGVGLTAPAAVQLSADGTEVVERVYTIGDRVVDQAELTALRGLGGDGIVVRSATLNVDSSFPPPRTGFLAAYSRARAQVAVMGGVEVGGALSKDVWVQDVQSGTWTRMEPDGFELGDVHATSWARAGLFILDVVGSGWHKRMRLVQVDPATRQFRAVTEWPYLGLFGTQYLTADQDGELLIASSSRLFRSHAIARVAVLDGEAELQGLVLGKGELADRPLVDSLAYTVVTQDRQGRLSPQRKEQLFSARGTWQDLGRCF